MAAPKTNWAPLGSLDGATVAGRAVTVRGWALDEDARTQKLDVHVYIDGKIATQVSADRARADIGRALPGRGHRPRLLGGLDVAAGPHQVCTYAINAGAGTLNPRLGCRR